MKCHENKLESPEIDMYLLTGQNLDCPAWGCRSRFCMNEEDGKDNWQPDRMQHIARSANSFPVLLVGHTAKLHLQHTLQLL